MNVSENETVLPMDHNIVSSFYCVKKLDCNKFLIQYSLLKQMMSYNIILIIFLDKMW